MNPAHLLPAVSGPGDVIRYMGIAAVLPVVLRIRPGPRRRRRRPARYAWRLIAACVVISGSAWTTPLLTEAAHVDGDIGIPGTAIESDH